MGAITTPVATAYTPTTFKHLVINGAAGDMNIWTPAAGKKIRLLGYHFTMRKDTLATGAMTLQFKDGATLIAAPIFNFPDGTAAPAAFHVSGRMLDDVGYLSLAADNILKITKAGGNFSAGEVNLAVWGLEE